MESIACTLCGSDDSETVLERADRLTGDSFQMQRCRDCGLIYLNPRPREDELIAYYPDHYEPYQPPADAIGAWRGQRGQAIKRHFVEKYRQPGRLLDVGCATGDFMAHMAVHGWEVQGVEISPLAAEIARERHGLPVITGRLADVDFAAGAFDVVTLWDVLEHVPNPLEELQRVRHLLVSGGLLVFTVPNLKSWDKRLFGEHWIGWDVPRHLYAFPPEPLEHMLSTAGFIIAGRRCIIGGVGAFLLSYDTWLKGASPRSYRRLLRTLRPSLSVCLWPYKELAYRLGHGPVETIACFS